jgi:phosphonate transport system substrate-binding protein
LLCYGIPALLIGLILYALPAQSADAPPQTNDTELVMGIFPRRAADVTEKLFTPLAAYLSRQLGRPIRLETTHNFVSFWDNVDKQRYDIVHFNQYHYVRSHKSRGYRVILKNEEHNRSTIAASLFVRKDSGINSIMDLKGRKIAFGGGKTAMVSYIAASHLLEVGGLHEGDYVTTFAINPPRAAIAVYYQQASAAGAGDIVKLLPRVRKEIDVSELKSLATSPPMAHLPWAVKQDMSPQISRRIQAILSQAEETPAGKKVLAAAQLTNLIIASDTEYDPHREIIRSVLGESY